VQFEFFSSREHIRSSRLVVARMNTEDLVDFYVDQLRSTTDPVTLSPIIQRALEDRQLFLYGEILETLQNHPSNDGLVDEKTILEIFSYSEFKDANDAIVVNPILLEKLRMLTVISAVSDFGLKVPAKHLLHRLGMVKISDLFALLVRMTQLQLVTVSMDEREGKLIFTSNHLFREIPRNASADYICRELLAIAERLRTAPQAIPEKVLHCSQLLSACNMKNFANVEKSNPDEMPKKTPSKRVRQHSTTTTY